MTERQPRFGAGRERECVEVRQRSSSNIALRERDSIATAAAWSSGRCTVLDSVPRAQQHLGEVPGTRENLLRQWGPVIGQLVLVTYQRNPALVPLLPQRFGSGDPGRSGANDADVVMGVSIRTSRNQNGFDGLTASESASAW